MPGKTNRQKGKKGKKADIGDQKKPQQTAKNKSIIVHLPNQKPVQRTVENESITIRLPNQEAVQRPLKKITAPNVVVSKPAILPAPQSVPVRLPFQGPSKAPLKESAKFLNLPGEIRNKIYAHAFKPEFFEIRFADKAEGSLTYRLPNRPRNMQPHLEPDVSLRRRLYDWPRRVQSKESIPVFKLSPGPTAFLLTCKKVNEEASPLFYAKSAFTFQNLRAFDRFLNTLGPRSKASIRSLHLTHHTAGNAFDTLYQPFTRKFDQKWDNLCWKASEELLNLEELSIDLMINEVPISFDTSEKWMMALLSFEAIGLKRCSIILHNHFTPEAVLRVEAYKIRQTLLEENFVDGPKGEAAWMRRRLIPKRGAKILRLVNK